ncbi:phosphoadenosine phosphosulfate reductase domain-containing protein [Flammeovirga agarivorans]|uniref:Phosphoadenosine phosphosulfate reductase family protein n=1 Tax=Flammeovirga agarivorans TaxID=2726742 RepID=A0A7X8SKI4_9BACT|nr:phosphoadenosine phosphosulfate reductase family protein [Flammeovirga agarivorans]NLR91914.1 phosphoadenosine phosphosulfate reductase family protein [Flammeovirga agarivorans]
MSNVRHLLGISGGKDSAALAIYLNKLYPKLDMQYYTCDTGRELQETYKLIDQLQIELNKDILQLDSVDLSNQNLESAFDYFLAQYGGLLPAQNMRWCTKKMKLDPFENWIGDVPTISYVGIRGDEDREGYISTKPNIQSIFPFRKNIWSEDVIKRVLDAKNEEQILEYYPKYLEGTKLEKAVKTFKKKLNFAFSKKQKVEALLNIDIKAFNKVVFDYLKTTELPVGQLDEFPLVENNEILVRNDIFQLIEESAVDLPGYYKPLDYVVDGEKGKYFRSRSGCFFCFYQQKIEWVWLLENHPKLFEKAKSYEKEGYSWIEGETLDDLAKPERVEAIKREHLKRKKRAYEKLYKSTDWQDAVLGEDNKRSTTSNASWLDELSDAEGDGCASCFI